MSRVLDFPTNEGSSPNVPAGTWADDDSEAARSSERLLRPAGQVVAFPLHTTQTRLRAPKAEDAPGAGAPPHRDPTPARVSEPPRPQFLASELLRHDAWPAVPAARPLRFTAAAAGGLGAAAVLSVLGPSMEGLLLGLLLVGAVVAGALPLRPLARGGLLLALGGLGAAWVSGASALHPMGSSTPLLMAAVSLAASASFFRASHPLSRLARAVLAVSLIGCASALALGGGLEALVVEDLSWQAWVGPLSRGTLGLVVLAGLLSFLDPTGPGHGWGIGGAFVGWVLLDAGLAVAVSLAPAEAALAPSLGSAPLRTSIAVPFFVAIAAIGSCPLWARLSLTLRQRAHSRPLAALEPR